MPRPQLFFGTVLVLLAVALTTRLGFWQLQRLEQRRALNAQREQTRSLPVVELPTGDSAVRFERPARALGSFTTAAEFTVLNQVRKGMPGVRLVTPMRLVSGEWLLVDRGWVRLDQREGYHPPPTMPTLVLGYLALAQRPAAEAHPQELPPYSWLALNPEAMGEALRRERSEFRGAKILSYALVATSTVRKDTGQIYPIAAELPPLDEGPHKSYAIQWFSFSVVFVVGWLAYVFKQNRDQGDAD